MTDPIALRLAVATGGHWCRWCEVTVETAAKLHPGLLPLSLVRPYHPTTRNRGWVHVYVPDALHDGLEGLQRDLIHTMAGQPGRPSGHPSLRILRDALRLGVTPAALAMLLTRRGAASALLLARKDKARL